MSVDTILQGIVPNTGKFQREFTDIRKKSMNQLTGVYLARHKVDQQEYAIKKIVHKVSTTPGGKLGADLSKLLQEVRVIAAIRDSHVEEEEPKGPSSCDASITGMRLEEVKSMRKYSDLTAPVSFNTVVLYIQVEHYQQTLYEYLSSGPDEFVKRLEYATQIIEGLYTIHKKYKLVHGNLSPKSIYIGCDGKIKIGDFGLATKSKHLIPIAASPCISPVKIFAKGMLGKAKEQSPPSESHSQQFDIYNLGIVLLELLQSGPYPESAFKKACPELFALIQQMISVDPAQRPDIRTLKKLNFFSGPTSEQPKSPVKKELSTELKVRIGDQGKWKKKHVKFTDSTLFVYNHKESRKAKLRYPIGNCRVRTYSDGSREERKKQPGFSKFRLIECEAKSQENPGEIAIEHGILETLYLELDGFMGEHKEWLEYLHEASTQ